MGGWFESKIIEEKYLPDKIYPQSGNINGEILEGDQERIDLWLKSNEGKFGNYKVVEFLGRMKGKPWTQNGANGITWKIQCDCGYERLISHRHLRSFRNHIVKRNSQPFCMNPKHDERFTIGKTFDRLTVSGYKLGLQNQTNINIRNKSRISKNKSRLLWLVAFSCSCGKSTKNNPYVTSHTNITREINQGRKVFGCGCLNLTQDGKSNSVEYERWYAAKERARKQNLPFNLEIEDCIAPKKCPILGITLKRSTKLQGPLDDSPSLDKIIPEKGYVKGNVIVISQLANRIKNDGTFEEINKVADWYEKELRKRNW